MSLRIEGLTKSFTQSENRIDVLKGLSLAIETGQVAAIIGQSGSGKSTLLSLLAGLDRADQGHLWVDSDDLSQMSTEELTAFRGQNIGIVFQQFHLVPHLTALENVALPMEILGRPQSQEKARAILEQMNLAHRLDHLPGKLSGGECQRVAIARALVTQPRLILADEPSGNLDLETGEKVMQVFFDIVRKYQITTVLVTHNPDLAQKCDVRFLLQRGVCVQA